MLLQVPSSLIQLFEQIFILGFHFLGFCLLLLMKALCRKTSRDLCFPGGEQAYFRDAVIESVLKICSVNRD